MATSSLNQGPVEGFAEKEFGRVFCLGFLLSVNGDQVAMIEKNKPAWQAGKLNGIGGKLDPPELAKPFDEGAVEAQVREFYEETGLHTSPDLWEFFGTVRGVFGEVGLFRHWWPGLELPELKATTSEVPGWYSIEDILNRKLETLDSTPFLVEAAVKGWHVDLQYPIG